MDHLNPEDSYAERRQLFKNIWETAMNIEEKDADNIMNKPKVIKTLRLDEVDRCGVNKRKKLKLKNLRHVCNKILDFCDKQEADDQFYAQMNAEGQTPARLMTVPKTKIKSARIKKKIKRSKSLHTHSRSPAARATKSERKNEFSAAFPNKTSRNTSPIIATRNTRQNRNKIQKTSITIQDLTIKGKRMTRPKRDSHGHFLQTPGVAKYNKSYYYVDIKPIERTQSPNKKPLRIHKVNIK